MLRSSRPKREWGTWTCVGQHNRADVTASNILKYRICMDWVGRPVVLREERWAVDEGRSRDAVKVSGVLEAEGCDSTLL